MYAIVRITGGVKKPEKLEWEELLDTYRDAIYVEQFRADMIAESVLRKYGEAIKASN